MFAKTCIKIEIIKGRSVGSDMNMHKLKTSIVKLLYKKFIY